MVANKVGLGLGSTDKYRFTRKFLRCWLHKRNWLYCRVENIGISLAPHMFEFEKFCLGHSLTIW